MRQVLLTRLSSSLLGGLFGALLKHLPPRLLQLDEVHLEEVPLPEELVRRPVRHHRLEVASVECLLSKIDLVDWRHLVVLPHARVVHHEVRDLALPLVQVAAPRLPVDVVPERMEGDGFISCP